MADVVQEAVSVPDAPVAVAEPPLANTSPRQRRLTVGAWVALGWVVLLAMLAVLAPVLPISHYKDAEFANAFQKPSLSNGLDGLLGMDKFGRSVLSRIIWGTRTSLVVGFAAPAIGLLVGGLLGLIAGFFRKRSEKLLLLVTDSMLAFPALVLLLVVVTVLGRSLMNIVVALAIISIPTFFRLTRAQTLVHAEREYVFVARALGAKRPALMFREILPSVMLSLIVYAPVVMAMVIVAEGSLSFLGLSLPPPNPSWGAMIKEGADPAAQLKTRTYLTLAPGLALFLTVVAFNTLGSALRRIYDPRQARL